jgi:hypothetical protein
MGSYHVHDANVNCIRPAGPCSIDQKPYKSYVHQVNKKTSTAPVRPEPHDPEGDITLGLLTAVEEDERLTQRSAAARLGIALGLTNAYLKRCVRKGLIKVAQIPPNRYAYYITPRGLSEKTRLTAQFFSNSFQFFRVAREQYAGVLGRAASSGARRVVFCGVGELSEIATLCAGEAGIEIIGILDLTGAGPERHAGHPVRRELAEFGPLDAVVITDFVDARSAYETLARSLPASRIMAPPMLGLRAQAAGAAPADEAD